MKITIPSFDGEVEVDFTASGGTPAYERFGRGGFSDGLPAEPLDIDVEDIRFVRADAQSREIVARFRKLPKSWQDQVEYEVEKLVEAGL